MSFRSRNPLPSAWKRGSDLAVLTPGSIHMRRQLRDRLATAVRAGLRSAGARWVTRIADIADLDRLQPPERIELPPGLRMLVIAPHPDDESIGCGGLIGKWTAAGRDAFIVFLTDGQIGNREIRAMAPGEERHAQEQRLAATRRHEARRATELLGCRTIDFLAMPDGDLLGSIDETGERLAACLKRYLPDLVVFPHAGDRHPDHVAAGAILIKALEVAEPAVAPSLLGYETWAPLKADIVIDVSTFMNRKCAAIDCHVSQTASINYTGAARALNRYRAISAMAGCEYAEAYWRGTPDDLSKIWDRRTS